MNIEVLIIQFLQANISGWSVTGDVPKSQPTKFMTVERTGGGREFMVLDTAEIQVSVYSKNSKLEAAEMADEIADLAPAVADYYEDTTRCKVNSVVQNDDTTRGYHRYLVFLDVYNRR